MSASEWLTVLVCAAAGYGAVNFLIAKWSDRKKVDARPPEPFRFDNKNSFEANRPSLSEDHPFGAAWHEILEVMPDASADAIRDAYKRQLSRYHPDKVASMGQEIQDVAQSKTKAIIWAYQVGLNERERLW